MLEGLFGGQTAEKVLLFLANYRDGYAQEIAETFSIPTSMVHKQLAKFERSGALVSRSLGRTRLYSWNPRFPFRRELLALLERALDFIPEDETKRYFRQRRRPRRKGKPS